MLALSLVLSVVAASPGASAIRVLHRTHALAHRSAILAPSFPSSSSKGLNTQSIGAGNSTTGLSNTKDNWYLANITLGGSEFLVQLDTGSTDLVLFPDRPIETSSVINDSQINATYGTGWYAGPIAIAKLEFSGHTVESQAFLNGTSVSNWVQENELPLGMRGIMGVALDTSYSWIHDKLDISYGSQQADEIGRNVLGNVFNQDANLDNFTVVFLGRTDDGEGTGEGYVEVGGYPEGTEEYFGNVSSIDTYTSTNWNVPVDAITVNGKMVALKSSVQDAPVSKAIALLDTGTSKAIVPRYVLDAMYSEIPNAWWSDDLAAWVVPCLTNAPNITITIGAQAYYIHPLDLTDIRSDNNYTVCTSSFGLLDFNPTDATDFILGDTFLRNVLVTYYYGDPDAEGGVVKSPWVKLLSTSDGVDADYADFLARRRQNLGSLPSEATKEQIQGLSQSSSSSDDLPLSESGFQAFVEKIASFEYALIGLLGAIFIVLLSILGVGIALCTRRSRTVGAGRTVDLGYTSVPLRVKEPAGEYRDEENAQYHQ